MSAFIIKMIWTLSSEFHLSSDCKFTIPSLTNSLPAMSVVYAKVFEKYKAG